MEKNYLFCGRSVSVYSPSFPFGHGAAAGFESRRGRGAITVMCFCGENLPDKSGKMIFSSTDAELYEGRNKLTKYIYSGGEAVAASEYYPGDAEVHCHIRRSAWAKLLGEEGFAVTMLLPHVLLGGGSLIVDALCVEFGGTGLALLGDPADRRRCARMLTAMGGEIISTGFTGISTDGGVKLHALPFAENGGICKKRSITASAVVMLSHGEVNALERLDASGAESALLAAGMFDRSFPEWKRLFRAAAAKVTDAVPVFSLKCKSAEHAAILLRNAADNGEIAFTPRKPAAGE